MKKACFVVVLACMMLVATGCASTSSPAPQPVVLMPLPQRPWVNLTYALRTINERAQKIDNVLAVGEMSLTPQGRRSQQLQVALLLEGDDHLRLRAWKSSQLVLDITRTPMGLWVLQTDVGSQLPLSLGQLSLLGLIMRGELPAEARDLQETSQWITGEGMLRDMLRVRFRLHKPTVTTRELALLGEHDQPRLSLVLDEYDLVNYQVWPRRLRAATDAGQVVITLREVEINESLPSAAFTPPQQATRVR